MNTTTLVPIGKGGLTVGRINGLIIEHKAPIKTKAVIKLVQEFGLTETDVDCLLEARADYSAGTAKMRALLAAGLTATQINGLYEARERIRADLPSDSSGVTIAKLLLVRDTFIGAGCDADSLTEIVSSIFEAARSRNPNVSPEAAIRTACLVATSCGAAMLETVLDIVRNYGVGEPEQ